MPRPQTKVYATQDVRPNTQLTDKSTTSKPEFVLAADLGGTHLRFAIVDDEGRIYFRQIQPTPQAEKPDEIVHALIAAARECEAQLVELKGTISAVSVAVPGTVNVAQGLVVKVPNVPALDGFQLAAALESELGWPVRLENDANAAAIGEMWRGAGQGYNTIICVTLGTGVGGGIILEGKLWRGADGSAGEIGHIAIDPFAGVPCTCGSQGCLEVYASATAIVRMTREAKPRYPQSVLREAEDFTSAEVFAAGKEGDELALEVFHRMGMYLGIGLATLINLLNPQVIIIGGGLANGWELFEKPMHQQVVERAFPIPAKSVRILQAQCGDNAGLLGAARLAFDQQNTSLHET